MKEYFTDITPKADEKIRKTVYDVIRSSGLFIDPSDKRIDELAADYVQAITEHDKNSKRLLDKDGQYQILRKEILPKIMRTLNHLNEFCQLVNSHQAEMFLFMDPKKKNDILAVTEVNDRNHKVNLVLQSGAPLLYGSDIKEWLLEKVEDDAVDELVIYDNKGTTYQINNCVVNDQRKLVILYMEEYSENL